MKKYDKIRKKSTLYLASGALVISAALPAATPAEANSSYTDTVGNVHEAAIKAISAKKVVRGYPDGTFKPSKVLSRSDVVKMLGKYLVSRGYEVPTDYKTYIRFSDLTAKTDDELLRYSALLHDLGIVKGNEGKLNPYDPILREQIAAVLSRLINVLLDLDVSAYVDYSSELDGITDLNAASKEFHSAIGILAYFDVTKVSEFRAKESTTRGQMASFIYRLISNVLENQAMINRLNALASNELVSLDDIVFTNSMVLSGSNATPGTVITIKDKNGNVLGSGTVGSDGKFTIQLSKPVNAKDEIVIDMKHPTKGGATSGVTVPPNVPAAPGSGGGGNVPNPGTGTNPDGGSGTTPPSTGGGGSSGGGSSGGGGSSSGGGGSSSGGSSVTAQKTTITNLINSIVLAEVSADGKNIDPSKQWTTAEEKKKIDDAVAAAKAVRDKSGVRISELRAAETTLKAAIDAYNAAKKAGTKVATTPPPAAATPEKIKELTDLIGGIKDDYVGTSEDGKDIPVGDKWTSPEAKQELEEAVKKAEEVAKKEGVTPEEIDKAKQELEDALDKYEDAKKDGTKPAPATADEIKELTDLIEGIEYLPTSTDGQNIDPTDQWTTPEAKQDLEDAVDEAKAVAEKEGVTAAEIEQAIKELEDALKVYEAAQQEGTKGKDLTATADSAQIKVLTDLIASVDIVGVSLDGNDIESNKFWTIEAQFDAINVAISQAQAVAGKSGVTVGEIDAAKAMFSTAKQQYENAKKPGLKAMPADITTLEDLIVTAEAEDTTGKPSNLVDALNDAIADAKDTVVKDPVSQQEVDDATDALQDALTKVQNASGGGTTPPVDTDGDGFSDDDEVAAGSDPTDPDSTPDDVDGDGVPATDDADDNDPNVGEKANATDIAALEDLIVTAEAEDTTGKPSNLVDALNDAIADAKDTVVKDPVSQQEVDDATTTLQDALTKVQNASGGGTTPPVDTDGDGFSDDDEVAAGSDPTDPDSTPDDVDGDGVPATDDADDNDPNVGEKANATDIAALEDLIVIAEAEDTTGKPSNLVDALNDAIADAKTTVVKDPVSQAEVDAATTTLQDALTKVQNASGGGTTPPVDTDGDGFSDDDEVAAGSDPTDPDSTPDDVDGDGVPATDDADDNDPNVGEKANATDIAALEDLIVTAEAEDTTGKPSNLVDALNDAIADAKDTVVKDPVSQQEVDNATTTLQDALTKVQNASGGGTTPPVDTDGDGFSDDDEVAAGSDPTDPDSTPDDVDGDGVPATDDADDNDPNVGEKANATDIAALEDLIVIAEAEDTTGKPSNLVAALNDAIADAKTTVVKDPVSQAEVDAATDALQDALTKVQNASGGGTTPPVDTDGDGFSDDDEVAAGSDPNDSSSTPDDKDGDGVPAVDDLDDNDPNIDGKADPADVTALEALIVQAEAEDTTGKPSNLVDALRDAIADAKTTAAKDPVSQKEVDAATDTLQKALDDLIEASNKTVKVQSTLVKAQDIALGEIMDQEKTPISFSTLGLGIGSIVEVDLLGTGQGKQFAFEVPKGGELSFDFQVEVWGAEVNLGTLDAYIAKKDEQTGEYSVVQYFDIFMPLALIRGVTNERTVTGLTGGEYVIYFEKPGIDLSLFSQTNFLLNSKNLVNPESDSGYFAQAEPITGDLTEQSFVEVSDINGKQPNSTTKEIVVEGNHGTLTVNSQTGVYSYVPFEKLTDIGKVDEFTYVVTTSTGKTVTNKLYVQTEAVGSTHGWEETNPTNPTVILQDAVDIPVSTTLQNEDVDEKDITPNLTNITGSFDREFTISEPYDVFTFKPYTLATGILGDAKTISYKVVHANDITNVIYEESKSYTAANIGDIREIRGLPVGNYKIIVTPIGGSNSALAGIQDVSVKSIIWNEPTVSGTIPQVANPNFTAKLEINGTRIADGTDIPGQYGTLTANADGTFTYKSNASYDSYNKSESFSYKIIAPNGDTTEAEINVTVVGNATEIPVGSNSEIVYTHPTPTTGAALPFRFNLGDGDIFATPQVGFNQDDE